MERFAVEFTVSSGFTKRPALAPLENGKHWVLLSDFSFDVGRHLSGDRITVPAGFVTDLTSVPRPLWLFYPRWGKYGNGAIIHDWLYWMQTRPRSEVDLIFLEAMEVMGVHPASRAILYRLTSTFGFIAWHNNQKRRARGDKRIIENPHAFVA